MNDRKGTGQHADHEQNPPSDVRLARWHDNAAKDAADTHDTAMGEHQQQRRKPDHHAADQRRIGREILEIYTHGPLPRS